MAGSGVLHPGDPKIHFDEYETTFNAREYLEMNYHPFHLKTQNGLETYIASNLSDIFNGDTVPENPMGSVLDFGCGPSILGAMCASRKFPNVVCADLVEGCRQEIQKWLNNEEDAFDWSPYMKFISDKQGIRPETLSMRTRKAIKHVIPCDARKEMPLGTSPPLAPYDIIIATLALQSACPRRELYISALKNICYHLKPSGLLILTGIFNQDYYFFGNPRKTYKGLNHQKDDIIEIFQEAGMNIKTLVEYAGDPQAEDVGMTGALDGTFTVYIITSCKADK